MPPVECGYSGHRDRALLAPSTAPNSTPSRSPTSPKSPTGCASGSAPARPIRKGRGLRSPSRALRAAAGGGGAVVAHGHGDRHGSGVPSGAEWQRVPHQCHRGGCLSAQDGRGIKVSRHRSMCCAATPGVPICSASTLGRRSSDGTWSRGPVSSAACRGGGPATPVCTASIPILHSGD